MRRDDGPSVLQRLRFCPEKIFVSAEIAERCAFGMKASGGVETLLQLSHWKSRHQNIECPSAEIAVLPKVRQKVLLDDDVKHFVSQPLCVAFGKAFVHCQQIQLTRTSLCCKFSRTIGTHRGDEQALAQTLKPRGRPGIIPFLES